MQASIEYAITTGRGNTAAQVFSLEVALTQNCPAELARLLAASVREPGPFLIEACL